jgi:hypothetical protein
MCGYFKNPIVVLSTGNEERIINYVEHGELGRLLGVAAQRKQHSYAKFQQEEYSDDPIFLNAFRVAQEIVDHCGKRATKRKLGRTPPPGQPDTRKEDFVLKMGNQVARDFYAECVEPHLVHIGNQAKTRLMKPGEVDDYNRTFEMSLGFGPKISVRDETQAQGRNSKSGGRMKNASGSYQTRTTEDGNLLMPIMFRVERVPIMFRVQRPNKNKPKWKLIGFELPTYRERKPAVNVQDDCVPQRVNP